MAKKKNTVEIGGREYLLVAERIKLFRADHPDWTIDTSIITINDDYCITKTYIKNEEGRIIATGLAREEKKATFVNKTSFLEVSETSSIGRAIAFVNEKYMGDNVCSADELATALLNQAKSNEELNTIQDKVDEMTPEKALGMIYDRGKYKENPKTFAELLEDDPQYLEWLYKNNSCKNKKEIEQKELLRMVLDSKSE